MRDSKLASEWPACKFEPISASLARVYQ